MNDPAPSEQITTPSAPVFRVAGFSRRFHPLNEVMDSVIGERLRYWPVDQGPVDVIPQPESGGHDTDPSAAAIRGVFIPGSDPHYESATHDDHAAALTRLVDAATRRGWRWLRAARYPADRSWAEAGILVLDVVPQDCFSLASDLGAVLCLELKNTTMTIVDTHTVTPMPVAWVSAAHAPADTGCPLRSGAQEKCRPAGGWWTGRARTAARLWETQRELLVETLGCDICHGGPVQEATFPPDHRLVVPTRWSSWYDPR